MRNLFLALLLANLAFVAWQQWFTGQDAAPYVPPDVPTIELAGERAALPGDAAGASSAADAEVAAAPDETPAEPGAAQDAPPLEPGTAGDAPPAVAAAEPPPSRCVSVGPFRELAQAASAAANLRQGGYEPTQRTGEGDIWVGYWVYIDRIPSPAAAEEIVANLRENGITDTYAIPEGDNGSIVSLGVFSEIARAGARREEARRLGYDPVVQDRTRRGTVYWVDVMLEGQTSLDFDLLQSPGRILRLEQRPCEGGAA